MFEVRRGIGAVAGIVLGLAMAVPAGSADWSSSILSLGLGGQRAGPSNVPTAGGVVEFGTGADGVRADFEQDFGDIVLGGTFQQGRVLGLGGLGALEHGQRIDLRAGYDFGRSLGYVTLGEVGGGNGASDQRSQVYGFGLRVSVNRILQMTGEVLHREARQDGRAGAFEGDFLSVEAAFRF